MLERMKIIFSPELEKNFVQFIKKHYFGKNVSYSPESENIIHISKYHSSGNPCFLTYYSNELLAYQVLQDLLHQDHLNVS